MAEQVVQSESIQRQSNPEEEEMMQAKTLSEATIQRQCAECEQEGQLQRQAASEEEEMLQSKPLMRVAESGAATATPQLAAQLNSSKGSGQPLPKGTLSSMNNVFGADFSGVRVHVGSRAEEMSQGIQAKAFTHGSDIYFNKGQYNPGSTEGKRLLGHELAHVVQQGGAQNSIQRDPPNASPAEPSGTQPEPREEEGSSSFNPIADLVRSQLSDSTLRGHLQSLGQQLQELALEDTAEGAPAGERAAALGVSRAFSETAAAILQDSNLQHLRQEIERISEDDPGAILAAALAGLLIATAAGADIPLATEQEVEPGAGVTISGAIDLGTLSTPQFNRIRLAAEYAHEYFSSQVSAEVRQEREEGEEPRTVGQAEGRIRIGRQSSGLTGRLRMDTEGNLLLEGTLAFDPFALGSGRTEGEEQPYSLQLVTGVRYERQEGEEAVTIRPGLRGEFQLGPDQRLRLGSSAIISPETGFEGLSGSLEYQRGRLFLRFEGDLSGIPENRSLNPQLDLRVQGLIGVEF